MREGRAWPTFLHAPAPRLHRARRPVAPDPADTAADTAADLGQVRDVELHGGILYAASDCNCQPDTPEFDAWDGVGVRLYDLADPTAPRLLATIGAPTASVHNLTVSGGVL